MNILAGLYKTMGESLFRDYMSELSSKELGYLANDRNGFVSPWDAYDPRGIYVFLDIEEETGNEELSFAYVGTPTESLLEAAMSDRLTYVYYIGQHGLRVGDLEPGTVITYKDTKDSRVNMVGVKFPYSWDMSGMSESLTDVDIEKMVADSIGEFKFYFDGEEINVEGVK